MVDVPSDSLLPAACPMCGAAPIENGYVPRGATYSPIPPFFRQGGMMEAAAYSCGLALVVDPLPDPGDPTMWAPHGPHMGHDFKSGCNSEALRSWLQNRNEAI